ncbi:hypothetical protein CC78DRAFT_574842 [Lojkania enalia]|uniref:Uncharacterized protein n=1 Tax=Lojkania enalia TaxID=147567 RepID=A0A9P4NB67_9PLEO|nr:hypothetical protein CC78DRAFT_574842 [Didymosphaeria enalia]
MRSSVARRTWKRGPRVHAWPFLELEEKFRLLFMCFLTMGLTDVPIVGFVSSYEVRKWILINGNFS